MMEFMSAPDCEGWLCKYGVRCTDGHTFVRGSLKSANGQHVKWCINHNHKNPIESLVGFVVCEENDEGVYGYGFLNDTPNGRIIKELCRHGDLTEWSIFVADMDQTGKNVNKATLKEVSAVVFGGNPSAQIVYKGANKFMV